MMLRASAEIAGGVSGVETCSAEGLVLADASVAPKASAAARADMTTGGFFMSISLVSEFATGINSCSSLVAGPRATGCDRHHKCVDVVLVTLFCLRLSHRHVDGKSITFLISYLPPLRQAYHRLLVDLDISRCFLRRRRWRKPKHCNRQRNEKRCFHDFTSSIYSSSAIRANRKQFARVGRLGRAVALVAMS